MSSLEGERLALVAFHLRGRDGPAAASAWLARRHPREPGKISARASGQVVELISRPVLEGMVPVDDPVPAELDAASRLLARARERGVSVVTPVDGAYPFHLRRVERPPPVIYVKGSLRPEDRNAVAIVGARRATPEYLEFAGELAYELARAGMTIVSGLARGIDQAAHRGALEGGGRTIAVVGNGVDVVYPPEHGPLTEAIAASGAVVSFFPLGTPPRPHHFPARNWVIAALSLGVTVVQAGARSGARITADFAADLGRAVMAVPGPVEHPLSEGTHALIREGAALVASAEDILAEIGSALTPVEGADPRAGSRARGAPETGGGAGLRGRLHSLLKAGARTVDEMAEALREPVERVRAELVMMELAREATHLGGGRYRLRRRGAGPG